MMHQKSHRREVVILASLTILAALVRFWGLDWGLPSLYHPDENVIVGYALRMGKAFSLRPPDFAYPPLLTYVNLLLFGGWYGLGHVTGFFASPAGFEALYFTNPTNFYLIGRGLSATLGTLAVPCTYWVGKKLYNTRVGIVAALCLTFAFLHVQESHFATPNAALPLFAALTLLAAVKVARSGSHSSYIAAGILGGLAANIKYNAVFVLVPLLVAHLYFALANSDSRDTWYRRLFNKWIFLACGLAILTFLVSNPYALLDYRRFLEWMRWYARLGKTGYHVLRSEPGWIIYLKALPEILGWPIALASAGGALWAAIRRRRNDVLVLSFPLLYLFLMGFSNLAAGRYLMPIFPALAVLAGVFLVGIVEWVTSRFSGRCGRVGMVLAVLLVLAWPAYNVLRHDLLITRPDTRTLAKRWVERQIAAGAKILLDGSGPQLVPDKISIKDRLERNPDLVYYKARWLLERDDSNYPQPAYYIELLERAESMTSFEHYGQELSLGNNKGYVAYAQANEFEYVILTSLPIGRYSEPDRRQQYAEYTAALDEFLAWLDKEADLVQVFRPTVGPEPPDLYRYVQTTPSAYLSRLQRPGPTVYVFWLRP